MALVQQTFTYDVTSTTTYTIYLPTYNQTGLFMITFFNNAGESVKNIIVQTSSNTNAITRIGGQDSNFNISSSMPSSNPTTSNPLYANVYYNPSGANWGLKLQFKSYYAGTVKCLYAGTSPNGIGAWTTTDPSS